MAQVIDCPRHESDCPRPECEKEPDRVDERIIDDRKALVYWHDGFDSYCIEYPDGETSSHTRAKGDQAPSA